jgi:uncharacterized protein (UPF0335 family)
MAKNPSAKKGKGAKSTAPKTEKPPATHNAKALDDIRRECAVRMREINSERKDLNEDATAIRERLRDNGIDVKGFMAALRLADMEDVPARDTYLDELRLSMSALGLGQQGDLFQADKGPTPDAEPKKPAFLSPAPEDETSPTVN